jgi:sterol desaturase/sphingolipid hydroxylase (fatty acid hydroxylase superfamily)
MDAPQPSSGDYFQMVQQQVWPYMRDRLLHPFDKDFPFWENPVWTLFIIWTVMFILENVLPRNKDYPVLKRKGFWTDLLYVFCADFLFDVIGLVAISYTVEYVFTNLMKSFGIHFPLFSVSGLPFAAQFLLFFLLIDFSQFFAHYLLHRIEFLWKFHKVHHAQETLGFASTRHFHPFEYLVLKPLGWIPAGLLLGFSAKEYLAAVSIYVWIGYSFVFFSHCNVKVNLGLIKRIFITPETHYWHHAKNIPGRYGVNYASVLVIWDYLFRSFYLPEDEKQQPVLGVPDNDVPKNFIGQMFYPFKALFSRHRERQTVLPKRPAKGEKKGTAN